MEKANRLKETMLKNKTEFDRKNIYFYLLAQDLSDSPRIVGWT